METCCLSSQQCACIMHRYLIGLLVLSVPQAFECTDEQFSFQTYQIFVYLHQLEITRYIIQWYSEKNYSCNKHLAFRAASDFQVSFDACMPLRAWAARESQQEPFFDPQPRVHIFIWVCSHLFIEHTTFPSHKIRRALCWEKTCCAFLSLGPAHHPAKIKKWSQVVLALYF